MMLSRHSLRACSVSQQVMRRCYGSSASNTPLTVNQRQYARPKQGRPIVGICIDGCAPEYLDEANMPNWFGIQARREQKGNYGLASAVMPTYTNPNNMSIITGGPTKLHGIAGNYFWDEAQQKEVMMNDPSLIRCDTILAQMSQNNVRVITVTAKDKLRRMLSHGLKSDTSFGISIEMAKEENTTSLLDQHGLSLAKLMNTEPPSIYEPDISVYCVALGERLIEHFKQTDSADVPSLYYLSTTDFVQHKWAPQTPEADDYYRKIDTVIGALDAAGAVVGVTADHGMNSKVGYDGNAKVVYLGDLCKAADIDARVILPITDPYLLHHGGLGSFATLYLSDKNEISRAMSVLREEPGLYSVMNKEEAVKAFDMPGDRIGDIVIVSDANAVVGITPADHDLTNVPDLRSHGGLDEQKIPFWVNRPLKPDYAQKLTRGKVRNYDLFDFLCNGIQ